MPRRYPKCRRPSSLPKSRTRSSTPFSRGTHHAHGWLAWVCSFKSPISQLMPDKAPSGSPCSDSTPKARPEPGPRQIAPRAGAVAAGPVRLDDEDGGSVPGGSAQLIRRGSARAFPGTDGSLVLDPRFMTFRSALASPDSTSPAPASASIASSCRTNSQTRMGWLTSPALSR